MELENVSQEQCACSAHVVDKGMGALLTGIGVPVPHTWTALRCSAPGG